ncbi:MAG TPA: hypothetical protein VME18_05900 [Acidobacteriaceae bacterium]|nr:hypothetical protein [Acidobacteriaceae bacterium]
MPVVLSVTTALGLMGVVESFGLYYLAERWLHLSQPVIQTLIYLKLSVAGHLMLFVARTRGRFWSIRPAKILLVAVIATQLLATLVSVYGLFMTPIGWFWAAVVWGYAVVWFFIEDEVKLAAYRLFDGDGGLLAHFLGRQPLLTAAK